MVHFFYMKSFISWNVNGLRAIQKKGFAGIVRALDADLFAMQETKLQAEQVDLDIPPYRSYWNHAEKKGYAGTAVLSKSEPLEVHRGLGVPEFDHEGRVLTLEFPDYYFITCYTPNSQAGLARLDFRMAFEDSFLAYLRRLDAEKPLILCGDLNVAHEEIDLKNPESNHRNAGFSDEERSAMTRLLENGFTDSFRYLYPEQRDAYSWWSYRTAARSRNAGWRIDYFIVSDRLAPQIAEARIYSEIEGSDHCPVGLSLREADDRAED